MIDTAKAVKQIMSRRHIGKEQAREVPHPQMNPSSEFESKHLAASDMLDAFHARDHIKLAKALSAFLDMHKMESSSEEDYPAES